MGCMRSLCGVFRINPWKISAVAATLHTALCMTSKERRVAHYRRFTHVMKYTLVDWAVGFLNDLKKAARSEKDKRVLPIGFGSNLRFIYIPNDLTNLKQMERLLMSSYKRCKYKIVLFDYGGTLTDVDEMGGSNKAADIGVDGHELKDKGFNPKGKERESISKRFRPARSDIESYRDLLGITQDLQSISPKIIKHLQTLSKDPHTIVAIVSGQTRDNLDTAFKECPGLFMCAEKGAWFRYPGEGKKWVKNEKLPQKEAELLQWQNIVYDVLETYTERTNGSYIQRKSTALAWHYENADPHYGDMQATEAERYLKRIVEKHHNLAVQRYDHVRMIEVVPKEIHKGTAALKVIDEMMKRIDYNHDHNTGNSIFILAVGNDRSDEKMFEAVELVSKEINTEYGFTVRIGMVPTQARFYLTDQNQMLWLLNTLCNVPNQSKSREQSISENPMNGPFRKVSPMVSGRSQSYSHGLSSMAHSAASPLRILQPELSRTMSSESTSEKEEDEPFEVIPFQRLQNVVRSIDSIVPRPIPPTAPTQPVSASQYKMKHNRQPIEQMEEDKDDEQFIASTAFNGGFFDNVAVRSHSYTSLSRLERLTEERNLSSSKLGLKGANGL